MNIIKAVREFVKVSSIMQKYKALGRMTIDPTKDVSTDHVNLAPNKDFDPNLKGTLWARSKNDDGTTNLQQVSIEDFQKSAHTILALGGVDFDTPRHMSALLKSLEGLKLKKDVKCVAFFPTVLPDERFKAAVNYNKDKLFYPKYIDDLARKYILPKFLDNNGNLVAPQTPIAFYSFSVGGREIFMLENSLRSIFRNEYKCTDHNIKNLFSYLNATCIAYAFDYQNLPEPLFSKTIVFSVDDFGVLYPKALYDKVICQADFYDAKLSCISTTATNLSPPTYFLLLGHKVVPYILDGNRIAKDCHSLPHYLEAIKSIPEVLEFVQASMNISGSVGIDHINDID